MEYEGTVTYVNVTEGAVDVEEKDTTTYIDISDAAMMVEYIVTTGECGIDDHSLTTYMKFARGLHCYLSRPDEVGLSITGALTIGAWVWFDIGGRGFSTAIIGKWYEVGDERSYVLYKDKSGVIKFSISETGVNNLNTVEDGGENYTISGWHYIVGRYTPSKEMALFIDGNWYSNGVGIFSSIHDSTEPFEIARYNRDNYFDGRLCHIFVCATSVDTEDIEAVYHHTRAMFQAKEVEPGYGPIGITERMTNSGVMIEYLPDNYLRMTNSAVMIEYAPPTYERMTDAALMIEYVDATDYLRSTNAGVMIEYVDSTDYLRTTSAAVMVEYSSSSSSSSSTTTSSSSTTVPP